MHELSNDLPAVEARHRCNRGPFTGTSAALCVASSFAVTLSLSVSAILTVVLANTLLAPQAGSCAESAPAPAVLPSDNIFGNAKMGYMAAKRIPEICGKIFCYCGCDLTDSHSTLLDCFTSDHGVDCNICQEEALLALKMHTEGKDLPEIQKAVDQKYVAEYNSVFDEPSEMLKKYRAQRLWKPTAAELASENVVGKKGSESHETKGTTATSASSKKSSVIKSETKKTHGSCCGHK